MQQKKPHRIEANVLDAVEESTFHQAILFPFISRKFFIIT